jgi:hypothetical protein
MGSVSCRYILTSPLGRNIYRDHRIQRIFQLIYGRQSGNVAPKGASAQTRSRYYKYFVPPTGLRERPLSGFHNYYQIKAS